jgi:hypothetical protein
MARIKITEDNELNVFGALRKYYEKEFKNGKSDEAFLVWIENMLDRYNKAKH